MLGKVNSAGVYNVCCDSKKCFFGLKIFKPVLFLFSFVLDYGNEYCTKENKLSWFEKF